MASKSSEKLSFILYEEKKVPKYFEIKKSSLRLFLIGLPLITGFCILAFLLVTLYQRIIKKDFAAELSSITVKELQLKNETILQTNRELQLKIDDLTQAVKIAQDNASSQSENTLTPAGEKRDTIPSLSLFPQMANIKDQTQPAVLSLKQSRLSSEKNNIVFSFGMVNEQDGNTRINGYLIVMMKYKNSLHFYPNNIINKELQSPLHTGEYFSFANFRPVRAVFPYKNKNRDKDDTVDKEFSFKVFIFSKEGNLLHQQIFNKKHLSTKG